MQVSVFIHFWITGVLSIAHGLLVISFRKQTVYSSLRILVTTLCLIKRNECIHQYVITRYNINVLTIQVCFRLRDGLKVVLNISKLGNQYIQANKPWVLVKGNEDER